MRRKGFCYHGGVTRLEAGDEMTYDPVDQTVSFSRPRQHPGTDHSLYMNGDDKFILSNIRGHGDFWSLARLIAILNELQCTAVEETTGPCPLWWVTFHGQ